MQQQTSVMRNDSLTPPRSLFGKLRLMGPGMLVAGAFVGTGTITTSIIAGTEHGYQLLWASVTFAIVFVIILQEMSVRLTLATGETLATLIRTKLGMWASLLAVGAIFLGNSVYNLGSLNGLALATGSLPLPPLFWVSAITFVYWLLLMLGRYKLVEKAMTAMVGVMSLVFLVDMIYVQPDYASVVAGLTTPRASMDQVVLVTGLIGTTVVPYNLYLQSSAIMERGWHRNPKGFLAISRIDTIIPVLIGGIVTMAVGVVAAAVLHPAFLQGVVSIENAADMSATLEPMLGPLAHLFFNVGLFTAALSSALMNALAAAYVLTESFKMPADFKSKPFRWAFSFVAWAPVLVFAFLTVPPVQTIIAAQSMNTILLPITGIFVLILVNKKSIMGNMKNNLLLNILSIAAVIFVCLLGSVTILKTFGVF